MTAPSRETAGAVRSAHVAYFLPPDWGRVARHIAPALERAMSEAGAVRLLVLVPDAEAAVALTRALSALPAAAGRRLVAASSAARLQRLLGLGPAEVVVGPADVLAAGLGASALKVDAVAAVVLAAADEIDPDSDALAAVLADLPRDGTRILTALTATPGVESLLERYFHRARRVVEDVVPAEGAAVAPTVRYLTVTGSPVESLAALLDELDAPSAAVVAADQASAAAARTLLAQIGYADGPLAQVTTAEVRANTALVVTLGVPSASVWQAAVDAQPAQIVAIVAPRDLTALRLVAGRAIPRPIADRASISRARAAESRKRAELRAELAEGVPAREVLALEPLLREYDGLEIAAAALRLLERTRAAQSELVTAAEQRVRSQLREAQKEKELAERGERGERGERPFKPRAEGPRGGPRNFTPRGRDDRPRGFTPRDREDRPRSGGPPRADKPRGPRPPRGER